jgi:NitT/TauT family transport system permease protein
MAIRGGPQGVGQENSNLSQQSADHIQGDRTVGERVGRRRINRTREKRQRGGPLRGIDSVVLFVVAVGVWWLVAHNPKGAGFYLSNPPAVARAIWASISSSFFWKNAWSTFEATLVSFAIGSAVGILAGLFVSVLPRLEGALEPFAATLNSLPRIALAPIFIAFLGITQSAKIAVGISLVFFVLYYNTRSGIKSADRDWLLLAGSLGMTAPQVFRKILLPVAWPSLFAGLRLGFTYALLGVVSTEIIAARAGLGLLVVLYASDIEYAKMYAVLVIMAVLAGSVYGLTGLVEKRIMKWNNTSIVM